MIETPRILAAALLTSSIALVWLAANNDADSDVHKLKDEPATQNATISSDDSRLKTSWATGSKVQKSAQTPNQKSGQTANSLQLDPALTSAFQNVAAGYAVTSQFPSWSVPLDQHQTDLLNPNGESLNHRDLTPAGLPLTISMALSAYRYAPGEIIEGAVSLSGDADTLRRVRNVSVAITDSRLRPIKELNEELKAVPASQTGSNSTSAGTRWETHITADPEWPQQLNYTTVVTLNDGQTVSQSSPFQVTAWSAMITGVGSHWQEGNELVIPVTVRDASPGYYKLGAALFDQQQQPVAYLQGKQSLTGSSGTIKLRVWGSLLQQLEQPQKLWLGSFQLRNVPSRPGSPIQWGHSQQDRYPISTVDPARFDAEPYQDEQAQARLEFLQALGTPAH